MMFGVATMGIVLGSVACAAEPADDAGTATGATTGAGEPAGATLTVRCKAKTFAFAPMTDAKLREQSARVVLDPNTAMTLDMGVYSEGETFTVTTVDPVGQRRVFTTASKNPRDGFLVLGNTTASPQTYALTVSRSAAAKSGFTTACDPIVMEADATSQRLGSGVNDQAVCLVSGVKGGVDCMTETDDGPLWGRCLATRINIGAPTPRAVGVCGPR
jgi:hypothetical protein